MSKPAPAAPPGNRSRFNRFLDAIETAGNKLPDPVFIFIILLCGHLDRFMAGSTYRGECCQSRYR